MRREPLMQQPYPINLICEVCFADPSEFVPPQDMELAIQHVLNTLRNPQEQTVLLLRYREKLSTREVAERMDLTTSRVRQIESYALRRLRHPSRSVYVLHGFRRGFLRQLRLELQAAYDQTALEPILEQSGRVDSIHAIPDAFTRLDVILLRSFFHPITRLDLYQSEQLWMRRQHIDYIWQLCLLRPEEVLQYTHNVRTMDNISLSLSAYRLALDDGLLSGKPELADYALHRHAQLTKTAAADMATPLLSTEPAETPNPAIPPNARSRSCAMPFEMV